MVIFDQIGRVLGSASPIGAVWVSQNGHFLMEKRPFSAAKCQNAKNPREWQAIEGLGVPKLSFSTKERPFSGFQKLVRKL